MTPAELKKLHGAAEKTRRRIQKELLYDISLDQEEKDLIEQIILEEINNSLPDIINGISG